MPINKSIACLFFVLFCLLISNFRVSAQGEVFVLTAEALRDGKAVELNKSEWKYHAGDDPNWANPQLDDATWETVEGTTIKPNSLPQNGWNGRAWFRLHLKLDENLADKDFALITTQKGASEIYLDNRLLARFGEITDGNVAEYNPNKLPIPFRFSGAGEHMIAVRFASATFADMSRGAGRWLTNGKVYPGFSLSVEDAGQMDDVIRSYANASSMRTGFLFIGILVALALLHFLLYLFYRVQRANLFYSIYAAAFAILLACGNLIAYGHQSVLSTAIASIILMTMIATVFVALMAFVHVAFERKIGRVFWTLAALWAVSVVLNSIFLNNVGKGVWLTSILIALSFSFSIWMLVGALREKRPGAWILTVGVQILSLAMFGSLINQFNLVNLPRVFFFFSELAFILSVPIAVSIFLARNFARTNRDLQTQLAQVEELSLQKIEHERHAAELRAENDRRTKELEEARQLQLSMLPKKLPQLPNLEIAAYMKPATEVGGDYYDFHIGADGVLTVAIGDATGHGLKAGTVVTATKSLFNNLAHKSDIGDIFKQISRSLKAMNLRGLFMAMTMLKLKGSEMSLSFAGMPSALIYRHNNKQVEEIVLRALPLGSFAKTIYKQCELSVADGDVLVLMSDGFPEMFNPENEILGFDKAAEVLPRIAHSSAQEIINHLVKVGEDWANGRPQDDDVTFVVLKVREDANTN